MQLLPYVAGCGMGIANREDEGRFQAVVATVTAINPRGHTGCPIKRVTVASERWGACECRAFCTAREQSAGLGRKGSFPWSPDRLPRHGGVRSDP